MPFQKGRIKTGGQIKGQKKSQTLHFREVLIKHNFCAASALIECYKDARKVYDNYGTIYDAICEARERSGKYPTDDKAHLYLKIASDIAKDLASYSYPKLKQIEFQESSQWKDMAALQRLEFAMNLVEDIRSEIQNAARPTDSTSPG